MGEGWPDPGKAVKTMMCSMISRGREDIVAPVIGIREGEFGVSVLAADMIEGGIRRLRSMMAVSYMIWSA